MSTEVTLDTKFVKNKESLPWPQPSSNKVEMLFSSIIVFAKKEKFNNLLLYDAINKILNKNKILAPYLYKENYNKNYIEIQDFGNETIFKKLYKNKNNKFRYFKKIINLLNKIQLIKIKKIKNFKNKNYIIPKYEKKILIQEANLFCDWYLKKNLPKITKAKFSKKFKKITKQLTSNLKLKNNFFVHRDFHVSNIMPVNKKLGIIDTQDAILGNPMYDLASLLDDVRVKVPAQIKGKILKYYLKKCSIKNKQIYFLKNDFDLYISSNSSMP